MNQLKNN